ncbi:pyridoxamine 5'-phosphate oxidase family protein [Methanobacterium alkalithermotolerans]|uniref:Pyridoxamine 5'-phosphate oxidase family protein n=1 Tax=Methanobacterium alkalithermotolerans TaxID=2731220 RepID=A0A8T8K7L4_9EURY|nr:pyridoxamine 5'-phosphate oxidase family protein [Methanobacterium alkalithermotolerans]QUH23093.1 pyridoxamine 5'-phosphate oxidase family protein [Methanobacterium alkalithermotolerans]
MSLYKIPLMEKEEYDEVIKSNFMSRIAFNGEYPYIAPFLYVFDEKYIYFLSTKYGKKIQRLQDNPKVAVEIEEYTPDLSEYKFVSLRGRIEEETDPHKKKEIRSKFAELIKDRELSKKIMAALGHDPDDPLACLVEMECSFVWKLVDVKEIIALKN